MRRKDVEQLKQQLPLLDYLKRHAWTPRRRGRGGEVAGLCPLHRDSVPSFSVNVHKNLFYCHGCGRGGDVIRLVEWTLHLPFADAIRHLELELGHRAPLPDPLEASVTYYQRQLQRHPEALEYLSRRGLRDPEWVDRLRVGYAPGGCLRAYLTELGYPVQQLVDCGLLTALGRDAFWRRIVFPFPGNLYGRSLGATARHRFLAGSKGGLYAWDQVRQAPTVILVEGLFDLAVLWQAGFLQTTCAYGTHLNAVQWEQLCDRADRTVYIAFDQDHNGAGPCASDDLAWRLRAGGREARQLKLPDGYDPNRYFTAGATAADFARCLELAR